MLGPDRGGQRKLPMRIKICGITTPDDAIMAAEAGADAIGLNFVGGPRRIDIPQAEAILSRLPPFVVPVALVRLTGPATPELNEQLAELLATRWVSHVQVYGDVTPDAVARLAWEGYRPIVPIPVRDAGFARERPAILDKATAVLLDAHDPNALGGTGRTFTWSWVADARERRELADWPPIILAGGLTPENVARAIAETRPYGIDVSSGVEDGPGRKSRDKLRRFIAEARKGEGDEAT